jgi:hypothetical protein
MKIEKALELSCFRQILKSFEFKNPPFWIRVRLLSFKGILGQISMRMILLYFFNF